MRSEGGRYPMTMIAYDKNNIRVTATRFDDSIVIRIDDIINISRWEELSITVDELKELLNTQPS